MAPVLTLSVAEVALMLGVGQSTVYDPFGAGTPVPLPASELVSWYREQHSSSFLNGSTDVSEAA
jgi:hypothetical protein